MSEDKRSNMDQILDLLLDALADRQQVREMPESEMPADSEREPERRSRSESLLLENVDELVEPIADISKYERTQELEAAIPEVENSEMPAFLKPEPTSDSIPEKLPSIQLNRMLARLAIAIFTLAILVNIPFNRHGTNLARAMPDARSLVIRDGLVLKGSGDEIYVLEGNKKRWITSLDYFDYAGYRWEQVHLVEDEFLAKFPEGKPLHLLLRCGSSPHVYALENSKKRWIKDIPTFQSQGFEWKDTQIRSCAYLRNLPDGEPIPADAGIPPQP